MSEMSGEWWADTDADDTGSPIEESPPRLLSDHPLHGSPLLHSPPDRAVGITSPVRFIWTAVPNAKRYKVWAGVDDDEPSVIGSSTDNYSHGTA